VFPQTSCSPSRKIRLWASFTRHNIEPAGIMPECPKCGGHLVRTHRGPFRKFAYSALFRCRQCGFRTGKFHSWLSSNYRFVFSRYTRCVRCGTCNVRRGSRRDRIDGVSGHPFSLLQHILGAPLKQMPGLPATVLRLAKAAAQWRLICEATENFNVLLVTAKPTFRRSPPSCIITPTVAAEDTAKPSVRHHWGG
jgi:predicted RNA-binding Zn-ribbon protein involved in translation (DUF1610 family)